LGGSDGTDAKTLDISHLPDHVHTMKDENGSQYYGMKIGAGDPIDDQVIKMPIDSGTGGTHGLTHSGPVKSESIGQELNLMNPYLALNYIIYTGK
jgi:microcystin-dependent protein